MNEGNLESQKEFLEKIGSNFILKERRLNFSTEGTFRLFFKDAPFLNWRRGRDSNPGILRSRALQARAFDRSATSPKSKTIFKIYT